MGALGQPTLCVIFKQSKINTTFDWHIYYVNTKKEEK